MASQNAADSPTFASSCYTVGQLIGSLKTQEANAERAASQRAKITGPLTKGTKDFYYESTAKDYSNNSHSRGAEIARQPGVERLRLVCDAAGGEWSSKWVRQKLAEFCLAENVDAPTAEAMTVVDFVERLAPMGDGTMRVHGLDRDFEAWQKRIDNCEFVFPDEFNDFFDTLSGRVTDALSSYGESQWQFSLPIDKGALARRNWLDKALQIVKPLAADGGTDLDPLYWFERYIHGDEERDSEKAKAAFDAIRKIALNVLGHDVRYIPISERDLAEQPIDYQDYVSASDIRTKHTPDGIVLDHRKLKAFLKVHPDIRTAQPPGKDGKPRKNRLIVHLADWHKNREALAEWYESDSDAIETPSEVEVARRRAAVDSRKKREK